MPGLERRMENVERHAVETEKEDLCHRGGRIADTTKPSEFSTMTSVNYKDVHGAGLIGAGAFVAALAGALLWLTMLVGPFRLATGLSDARRQLQHAQDTLSAGQAKSAGFHVLAASSAARRAREGLDAPSPLLDLAAAVPIVDNALKETDHLVAAAEFSAAAASGTYDIANNALSGPERIIAEDPNNPEGSIIRLDRVEDMAETVTEVRSAVRGARRELSRIDLANLPRRFRGDVTDGMREMTDSDKVLADAAKGFALLPAILGADGPRTYLFGMQNSAELRGTGGALLQYAVLTFDGGRASFERPGTVYDVDRDRRQVNIPLPADAWYVQGIPDAQRFGNANWSPDWPLSARVTVDYARASSNRFPEVDGFIALDPVVLEKLVPGVGPYRTKWRNRISAGSAVNFLLYKAYGVYPKAYLRRVALRQVVDGFFNRILNPAHPTLLVRGLGKSLATKHMQIWLADPVQQRFIESMGWSGKLATASNSDYLNVVQQNVGGNKLDYHATQTTEMNVSLEGADAVVDTEVAITNNVFGPQTQWAMGNSGPLHRTMINVYVPGDATLGGARVTPETCAACAALQQPSATRIDSPPVVATWTGALPIEHTELGKKVWTATLQVPPSGTAAFGVNYRVPDVVRTNGGRSTYRLVLQHQPKVHSETVTVSVTLPAGAETIKAPGFKRSGATLTWERPLERDQVLSVSWR
jgi:hypothetical protein